MQIMSARVEKASHDEILGLNYFTFIREVGVNDSLAQIQDGMKMRGIPRIRTQQSTDRCGC